MFILTIDSNDTDEIQAILKQLASERVFRSGCLGEAETSTRCIYEYETLDKQPWLSMCEFLNFNEDGDTLAAIKSCQN